MEMQSILTQLTLEEKASLCSGKDFWTTKSLDRLGIPSIMLTDGPHGLRKQNMSGAGDFGSTPSVPATCFPTASALAASWNRDLLQRVGRALGETCRAEQVAVILGPGANIKRSPVCGRNFEYFSEDPYLTGEMAKSHIQGVQSQGVGTSLKHFAANNQEHRRMVIDAVVDERALREIYLTGFETAVKEAQPWTVMCAYNQLNGTLCSENALLLDDILRGEWGFKGIVVTDWGAIHDRVKGIEAGVDLEMPGSRGMNDAKIVEAVQSGRLDETVLDQAVLRLLEMTFCARQALAEDFQYDREAHHQLAKAAAGEGAVLLKNEGGLLPLREDASIAVLGEFAHTPKFQAYGSSLIQPTWVENALDTLMHLAPERVSFAPGYSLKTDAVDEDLLREARAAAQAADVVVVFAGLTDDYESEGFDRAHMRLPANHNALIEAAVEANPNVVVVLSNGAPVEMPWIERVPAVLEGYLAGQAGGAAAAEILLGRINPSGKLAESFPARFEDNPSFKYFPQGPLAVEYRESIFVGYRYYDTLDLPVLFPFGHGLSYTTFEYSDLQVTVVGDGAAGEVDVRAAVRVRNTGPRAGKEIVQVYVRDPDASIMKPVRELKGFEKVALEPGEAKVVNFQLGKRAFAYYDVDCEDWVVEPGVYEIQVGASSRDIRQTETVTLGEAHHQPAAVRVQPGDLPLSDEAFRALLGRDLPNNVPDPAAPFTHDTPVGDLRLKPWGQRIYDNIMVGFDKANAASRGPDGKYPPQVMMMRQVIEDMPLGKLLMFNPGMSPTLVEGMLLMANGSLLKGALKLFQARRGK